LAENINYTGAGAAITISASNVSLDMNERTISGGAAGGNGIELSSGVSNVFIFDGVISDMTSDGILATAATSNVVIDGVDVYDNGASGMNFTSPTDLKLFNSCLEGNTGSGLSLTTASRTLINNCAASNNTVSGFLSTTGDNILIEESVAMENGANGIAFVTTTTSKVIRCATMSNTTNGISLTNCIDCEVVECNSLGNTVNGIHLDGSTPGTQNCYIHDNTLVRNGNINLLEESASGPNSILGNYAQNPSLARNYCEGLSGITTVTLQQSVPFISSPTPWDNINMIP
jgi:hypothetical protein